MHGLVRRAFGYPTGQLSPACREVFASGDIGLGTDGPLCIISTLLVLEKRTFDSGPSGFDPYVRLGRSPRFPQNPPYAIRQLPLRWVGHTDRVMKACTGLHLVGAFGSIPR